MVFNYAVLTIVVFGSLGGMINKFRDNSKDSKYWKSITKGVGAALAVPLFLKLVSSNIVVQDQGGWYNYFIFGGLCLITSIFSDKFFDSLSDKILKKVEDVENTISEIEDNNNEIDDIDDIILNHVNPNSKKNESKDEISKVIKSITNSKYSYRTISGIEKDTNINRNKLTSILTDLKKDGFAVSKKNNKGNDIWKIVMK